MKNNILIIENDKEVLSVWHEHFENEKKFKLHSEESIKKAILKLESNLFDLVILDFEMSKSKHDMFFKKIEKTPIFFLINRTSNKELIDKKDIFFFIKPIKLINVQEKINQLIENKSQTSFEKLNLRDYLFFPLERKIKNKKGEMLIDLTEKETLILREIIIKKAVSKEKLLLKIWGFSSNINTATLETHIYRLRKKLLSVFKEKEIIVNSQSGYKITK